MSPHGHGTGGGGGMTGVLAFASTTLAIWATSAICGPACATRLSSVTSHPVFRRPLELVHDDEDDRRRRRDRDRDLLDDLEDLDCLDWLATFSRSLAAARSACSACSASRLFLSSASLASRASRAARSSSSRWRQSSISCAVTSPLSSSASSSFHLGLPASFGALA